ncbi:hypothetical protein BKA65DRAFT_544272 [Rhexocercosporidium sp. MPI-PUGE-AT-0058]|nr:hypothetical protein BKA65DRAFT_544272 [Rhexocercosporidium sp. MPI-PUGE-AT-0058]
MVSKTALALAIALPLALLCLGIAVLLLRYRDQRNTAYRSWGIASFELAEAQKQLTASPAVENNNLTPHPFSEDDLNFAYMDFGVALSEYVHKWALHDEPPIPKSHSAARIEGILFPEPPKPIPINEGTDRSLFPNPHNYTPNEICSALATRKTRCDMLEHILMSIILKDISLQGPPTTTLLPFEIGDVRELNKLHEAIRTIGLKGKVIYHIANFWLYNSKPCSNRESVRQQEYHTLVESLFEPYFLPNADKSKHRHDLNKVLEKAAEFGKRMTGTVLGHIELRWGERDYVEWIVTDPAMYAVTYENKDKPYSKLVNKGSAMKSPDSKEIQEQLRKAGWIE